MWWGPRLIGSRRTTCCHRRGFPNMLRRPDPLTFKAATSSMDRRVKERLIGASILVVLIVLVVPELLSGPTPDPVTPRLPVSAPEPVRNVTVDLATSKAPVPVVETAAASPSPSAVPSAPPDTAAPPPTLTTAAAKPAIEGRAWAVQLGSFASSANADKLLHQLKAQGFSGYVLPGGSGASLRYRVRIGPMADRGSAAQAVAQLKSLGHVGSLVPPAPPGLR
jgi:DedD protein